MQVHPFHLTLLHYHREPLFAQSGPALCSALPAIDVITKEKYYYSFKLSGLVTSRPRGFLQAFNSLKGWNMFHHLATFIVISHGCLGRVEAHALPLRIPMCHSLFPSSDNLLDINHSWKLKIFVMAQVI
jgi:hypothetical protein